MKKGKINAIVVATDGSPSAAEASLRAIELARALRSMLVAVSVEHPLEPRADVIAEIRDAEAKHVGDTPAETAALATEADVTYERIRADGAVADEICRIAARHEARMIVIGAHGSGTVRRGLHASVATAVVRQARCPVLVVRDRPQPTAERRETPR